jgi:2-phosphoglycerate kinase
MATRIKDLADELAVYQQSESDALKEIARKFLAYNISPGITLSDQLRKDAEARAAIMAGFVDELSKLTPQLGVLAAMAIRKLPLEVLERTRCKGCGDAIIHDADVCAVEQAMYFYR